MTFIFSQNGIITLKITNTDFKNNQQYKLSLKLTATNRFESQWVDQSLKFGLIRIAQCSNYGKIYKTIKLYLSRLKINKNECRFLDIWVVYYYFMLL